MPNSAWSTIKTTLIVLATVGTVSVVIVRGGLVAIRFGWTTVKDHMAGDVIQGLEADAVPLRRWQETVTWSWNRTDVPYTVQPANTTFYKSGPDFEHRYFDLTYPAVSDPDEVEAAAIEVWRHFADEVERRNPAATHKLVTGWIYIEGQDEPTIPAGRVSNETAAEELPDEPSIWWNEVIESSLRFD